MGGALRSGFEYKKTIQRFIRLKLWAHIQKNWDRKMTKLEDYKN